MNDVCNGVLQPCAYGKLTALSCASVRPGDIRYAFFDLSQTTAAVITIIIKTRSMGVNSVIGEPIPIY